MADRQTRRQVVALLAGAASAGLAGCSDGAESEPTVSAGDPTPTATGTGTESTPTATETDTESTPTPEQTPSPEETPTQTEEPGTPTTNPRPAVDSYLAPADNYDGTIVDARRRSQITVGVAVEANGGPFGFGPPAVHVDNGATVLWEWTGAGGAHTVESTGDGPLDSGDAIGEPGVNYSYTFEEDGIYNYFCAPHQSLGMKGSIIVGDDYPTTD
ncbi:halocyanin domain-containing protein [Halomicroarcula sp. F28]|nr:halocyanin domain-containing protein [Halomicroarcula salinisoli]